VKKLSIIAWCWLWYFLAQCADMLTSLNRWGGEELNPFFRNELHQFVAPHALVGKLILTAIAGSLSWLAYKLVEPLDKRVAILLACVFPLYWGWGLWQVANDNLFWLMHWVNP
jgi:hypothetical protein